MMYPEMTILCNGSFLVFQVGEGHVDSKEVDISKRVGTV